MVCGTIQRISDQMTDLTTSPAEDGSTIYNGKVRLVRSPARPASRKVRRSGCFPSGTSPMMTPPTRPR
jgi:hypothetical protein